MPKIAVNKVCVQCGNTMKYSKDLNFSYKGVVVENLKGFVCIKCNDTLFTRESSFKIDKAFRETRNKE